MLFLESPPLGCIVALLCPVYPAHTHTEVNLFTLSLLKSLYCRNNILSENSSKGRFKLRRIFRFEIVLLHKKLDFKQDDALEAHRQPFAVNTE